MKRIQRSNERGDANHGWLKSKHTFSFAGFYDATKMNFRNLRVINEDRIAGGTGFGAHPHRDMEIISYVVKGALRHEDSMGTKAVILPGEVQRMSAGSGIVHSEFNHSPDEETHFFQIWILPKSGGGQPRYGQKSFVEDLKQKPLVLVISEDGRDGSISIKQDADVSIARLGPSVTIDYPIRSGRGLWVQVVKGEISDGTHTLTAGDALAVEDESLLQLKAESECEIILFDLA